MQDLIYIISLVSIGYLLGSLNTDLIVSKLYGINIREHGSKTAGLTNTYRVMGKVAAFYVLLGDVLKGVIASVIGLAIGIFFFTDPFMHSVSLLAAGVGAIIGHNWPLYFNFKGGKGALTSFAVLCMADWKIGLICITIFILITLTTRYVSLATITATTIAAILSCLPVFDHTPYFSLLICVMALVIIIKHRSNIKRLLKGQENRISV